MLEALFDRARIDRHAAFIPYIMAGDPDLKTTELILHTLARSGASSIELGVPYSDPLADGPSIAAAGQRALRNGVTLADVLALVNRFRDAGGISIILFTYYNPVLQYGIERFARDAASAGASAVIVPDIALEELDALSGALLAKDLDLPLLIAPTTTQERAARVTERATGFVYVVSRLGVTGANAKPNFAPLRAHIARLRMVTDKPLAVGFGISHPDHVRGIADVADGIIVGSAIIDAYQGASGQEAAGRVAGFVRSLVDAARRAPLPPN